MPTVERREKPRHIRRMPADDYRTLREVGVALDGIRGTLNLHTLIFCGAAIVTIAAIGGLWYQVSSLQASFTAAFGDLKGAVGRIEGKIDALPTKTGSIRPAMPTKDAFPNFTGVRVENADRVIKAFGELKMSIEKGPVWIFTNERSAAELEKALKNSQ